jgi:hypothetical protein
MTLCQTVQAAPAKTAELVTRLSAKSNQALKACEILFEQLSDELTVSFGTRCAEQERPAARSQGLQQ